MCNNRDCIFISIKTRDAYVINILIATATHFGGLRWADHDYRFAFDDFLLLQYHIRLVFM